MSPPATWRPLPLLGDHPPLLTSTRFAENSYTIHVTDLAHLWTESLDRRPIILRALKENTSIDPSDGDDNMASFLKCLHAAFDPSDPMHNQTSIFLSPSAAKLAGDDGLIATVTCELPKELSSTPLTWNMHLRKQPAEAVTRELFLPVVESLRAEKEKNKALVEEVIRQKDALAAKMLDKFEATDTPFGHVFPALGTRKVSREQAEARVKGLAPFDQAEWEASLGRGPTGDVDGLVQGVFGAGVEYTPGAGASAYAEGLGCWWRDMWGFSSGPPESGPRHADDRESTVGKRTAPQSQARSSPAKPRGSLPDDATASETGSEDEDEAPVSKRPARRLGAIGGARPRPPPPPKNDEETASESDEPKEDKGSPAKISELPHRDAPSPGSATASEDEAPPRPSPAKKRGPLGRIGGTARPREVSEDGEGSEGVKGTEEKGEKEVKEVKKPERKVVLKPVKKKRKF